MIPALLIMVATSTVVPQTLADCKSDLVWTSHTYEAALDRMIEEHQHERAVCQIRLNEARRILEARTPTTAAALAPIPEPLPPQVDDGPGWGWVIGAGAAGLAVGALATVIALAAGGALHK